MTGNRSTGGTLAEPDRPPDERKPCVDPGGYPGSDWEPELVETLHTLLHAAHAGSLTLDSGLKRLRIRYGDAVYSELIHLLSHLRFDRGEAKGHWQAILEHRDRMQERQGSPVDLRVALVSYFLQVNRKLENPKIIEMKLFEQTQASAYRDELTGLYNYRLFREYLNQEIIKSERLGCPLSLVMTDVDHFKTYNDRNGHEAGNRTLAAMGRLLSRSMRKTDLTARYGGEEFVMILPSTSKTSAHLVAERAREAVERHVFDYEDSQPGGTLTVSMGVATCPADATEAQELVRQADRAMYVAKAGGKNQVQLYGDSQRSHGRVDATLRGRFRRVSAESHPLTTVNVSEAGVLFISDRALAVDSLVEIDLTLSASDQEIGASGRVVHVEPQGTGTFKVALRFTEVPNADREALLSYIRELNSVVG